MTPDDKAGWMQSGAMFIMLFVFFIAVHRAKTPMQGAVMGALDMAALTAVREWIDRWKHRHAIGSAESLHRPPQSTGDL